MISLSIIIPHFNSVENVIKLLESIPLRNEIEIIVVDDNSTEDISSLVSYINESNKNIRLEKNTTENKGAGAARNCGLREAHGMWLLFADSDDFFVGDWYSNVEKYFESEYDIVYFAPTSMDVSTGKVCSRHVTYKELIDKVVENPTSANELNLKYCFCTPWSKMIRRAIQSDNEIYFDEILAANDVMFITKCAFNAAKITADRSVIYCVTRDGASMTTEKNKQKFMTRVDVLTRKYLFLEQNLSKKDFKSIHMDRYAFGKLVSVFLEHWGFETFMQILAIYRENHIKIWDFGFFNPITLVHKAKNELSWWNDINRQRKNSIKIDEK